jgi:hypothetical protein
VEITQEHTRQIEAIKSSMECPKDFECHKSGFAKLGRARIIGQGELLNCLEQRAAACEFSMAFGDSFFCHCPLRVYIAKNFYK